MHRSQRIENLKRFQMDLESCGAPRHHPALLLLHDHRTANFGQLSCPTQHSSLGTSLHCSFLVDVLPIAKLDNNISVGAVLDSREATNDVASKKI